MPLVDIMLLEGRTQEQKKALFKAVTDAIVKSIGAPRDAVRITLYEVPMEHYSVGGMTRDERDRQLAAQGKRAAGGA
jgi:4-oxalocrotonate tautomerase